MWTLLEDAAAYERFCQDFAQKLGSVFVSDIDFGRPPATYPCLATAYPLVVEKPIVPGAMPVTVRCTRMLAAFVYPHEVAPLLAAARTVAGMQPFSAAAPAASGLKQDDFNKTLAAHVLAITYYLVETGICKKAAYEKKYNEALANVDQWLAEDQEGMRGLWQQLGTVER